MIREDRVEQVALVADANLESDKDTFDYDSDDIANNFNSCIQS